MDFLRKIMVFVIARSPDLSGRRGNLSVSNGRDCFAAFAMTFIMLDALNTSAFLGSRFNSKIRQNFDEDRLKIGTRCLQNNPYDTFYFKSLLDGDEDNSEHILTELA